MTIVWTIEAPEEPKQAIQENLEVPEVGPGDEKFDEQYRTYLEKDPRKTF